jgi:hypothetical protein
VITRALRVAIHRDCATRVSRSRSWTSPTTCARQIIDANIFMRYKDATSIARQRMPETGEHNTSPAPTPARRRRRASRRGVICRRIGEHQARRRAFAFPASLPFGEVSMRLPLPPCLRFRHRQHRSSLRAVRRWSRLWQSGEGHISRTMVLRGVVYRGAPQPDGLGSAISCALWRGSAAATPERRPAAPRIRNGRQAQRAPRRHRPMRTRFLTAHRGQR